MAVETHQRKSWTASDYILAALGGCLAAAIIIIIVSAILSPGRIIFSVTHASGSRSNSTGGVNLKLTISANSTSHRAMVKYSSFFVIVSNSKDPTEQIITHAQVNTSNFPKDEYLSAPSVISINVNASDFTGHLLPRTVVLTTQVRFKIGVATTKVYYIKVFCPGVVFPVEGSRSPATCDG